MQPAYRRSAGHAQGRGPCAGRSRVPADRPVPHQQPDRQTVANEAGGDDTGFDFHFLRYPSVKITDSKKVAMRWTNQNGKSLVYFNRDLRCGRKLILKVESVDQGPDFGLIFGVTTCGSSQVFDFPYHLVDYCRPEYDCCGHSVWMKLRHFSRVGSYVVIERLYDAFIQFTFDGRFKKDMCDPPERGFGRSRAYPFLMLTGSVTSVRILPAVPSERPFYNRPAAVPLNIAGLRLSPQDHSYTTSDWIGNRNVSVNGLVLRRGCATGANRNYVFSSRAFAVGKTIQFQIRETDSLFPGTITFGVTTYAPDCVSLDSLPINSSELTTNRFSKNWYLSQDIIENTHLKQCLSVRRMPEGFTIKTGFKQIRYLFYVDPLLTVYPFFNFNGAIRSIELISNSTAAFNRTAVGNELRSAASHSQNNSSSTSSQGKCVICLDERADHMAVPCNHVAFCQSCSTQSMTHSDRKCPLCRKDIDRISKIFLA